MPSTGEQHLNGPIEHVDQMASGHLADVDVSGHKAL